MMKNVLWRLSLASVLAVMANAAAAQGDVNAGEAKAGTCLGCHGIPGYQNVYPTYKVPRIAGQNAAYLVEALKAYKAGNRDHKTMTAQAGSLSEQDMQDIAAYFASFASK